MTIITPIIIPVSDSSGRPSSYSQHFETKDGVPLHVTVNTSNKADAERLFSQMRSKLGLRDASPEEERCEYWHIVVGGIVLAIMGSLLAGLFFMLLHIADLINYEQVRTLTTWTVRVALFGTPALILMGCLSLFSERSGNASVTARDGAE